MSPRRGRLFSSLSSLLHTESNSSALTEAIPIIDDAMAARILDFAIRLGETMLVSGASASEVTATVVRVSSTYGLSAVHVSVTYNAISAAYHHTDATWPITMMRVVRGSAPDHERLQRLQALATDVGEGLALDAARTQFRVIRRMPFRYRPTAVISAQAMLAVGVAVMYGANWLVLAAAFVAAALAALTQLGLGKARVPYFFSQIAGAFVLTLAAALTALLALTGWDAAQTLRPAVIVASGIVLMLAGLAVVGAAQDAIDGFALTALGRILELLTQTLGVVVGILAGLETARVLGQGMDAPTEVLPLGPVPLQFLGAAVIAVAVAVYNGAGTRIIVVSMALSLVAWLTYLAVTALGFEPAAASGVGAFAGSFVGVVIAYRVHVPSVAITTAAILPMVPGAAVFRGLLAVVESGDDPTLMLAGFGTLASAAIIGVSLAVGASLGIYLGQPLRVSLHSVIRSRARVRR